MTQQFTPQQIKTRTALIVFLKSSTAPVVLYVEKPQEVYDELKQIVKSGTNVLIEKDTQGPLKKVCIMSNQISGIALQDEQYV